MSFRFVYRHLSKYTEEYEVSNQSPEWQRLAHWSPNPFLPPEHSTRTPAPLPGGGGHVTDSCQGVWKWNVSFLHQVF